MAKPIKKTQPSASSNEIRASQPSDVAALDLHSFEPDSQFNRRRQKVIHHLFKGLIANMKKNLSWTKGAPNLQDVEHVHFFHSVDSSGFPQEYTNEVGGHFHRVSIEMGKNGAPIATCGQPLRRVTNKKTKKSYIVPVEFEDEVTDAAMAAGGKIMQQDRHVHAMEYKGYDELNADTVRDIQRDNARVAQQSVPRVQAPIVDPSAIIRDELEVTDMDR